ncbi:MAG: hypothetical protein ACRDIB_12050 [Ardenticatenaceae bacterium]
MTEQELIESLRDHFGGEFHAAREEGWQGMTNFLVEHTDLSREQAREWLTQLQERGILTFTPISEPDSAAMLEAARYGEMPAQGTAEGFWALAG